MKRVTVGIIGCGVIGRAHLAAARAAKRVAVTAVADLNPAAARSAIEGDETIAVFDLAEALLNHDAVDAVVLALPAGARSGLAEVALRRGKHVLLEKPPAMHAGELEALAAACGDRVVACASSRFRHDASARAATRFLADDPLGPIRLVRFRGIAPAGARPQTAPPAWRLSRSLNGGGGGMVNWGIYDMDDLLGLMGFRLEPTRLLGRAWPIAPGLRAWAASGSDAETHDDWCDPADVAAVMRQADHPAVAVHWDVMHPVRTAGVSMASAYQTLRPWIAHVHVHDGVNRPDATTMLPIGQGDFDHHAALRLLHRDGYDGFISGEWTEGWMSPAFFTDHLAGESATLRAMEQTL